ncbi:MAG: hypothetical protein HY673_02875 [Chloroflexi bacterium]|nr:hypothetical protein [Chloroflexota bacterium]
MAIDVDLNGEGEPSLQTDVHETKLGINVVEVKMKTLTPLPDGLQLVGLTVPSYREGLAHFRGVKYANEALGDIIPGGDRLSKFFLGLAACGFADSPIEIDIRAAGIISDFLNFRFQFFGCLRDVSCKVLKQDILLTQKVSKALAQDQARQVALENHSVEHSQCAGDHVLVYTKELFHSLSPVSVVRFASDSLSQKDRLWNISFLVAAIRLRYVFV